MYEKECSTETRHKYKTEYLEQCQDLVRKACAPTTRFVLLLERLPRDSRVDDVLSEPALTSNDWLCIVLELVVKLPDR